MVGGGGMAGNGGSGGGSHPNSIHYGSDGGYESSQIIQQQQQQQMMDHQVLIGCFSVREMLQARSNSFPIKFSDGQVSVNSWNIMKARYL